MRDHKIQWGGSWWWNKVPTPTEETKEEESQ